MDTSKEYILMCDTVEIQTQWTPKDGDCFYIKSGYFSNGHEPCNGESLSSEGEVVWAGDGVSPCNDYPDKQIRKDGSKFSYDDGLYIWLPRQDQLQEMTGFNLYTLVDNFYYYCMNTSKPTDPLRSMEQAWFHFVMKTKFNKTWNGEDWS